MKTKDKCADGCAKGCEHDKNLKKFPGYTPEPWSSNIQGDIHGIKSYRVARTDMSTPYGYAMPGKDNAARIVQCVNACAGIENPEAVKELVDSAQGGLKLLEALRDYGPTSEDRLCAGVLCEKINAALARLEAK